MRWYARNSIKEDMKGKLGGHICNVGIIWDV